MAFRYVYCDTAGDPVIESFPLAAVTTIRNELISYNAAGFLTNADFATVTTVLTAGVGQEVVVNAAGAAGALQQPIICTKGARYVADTTGAVERTDIGTNVTIDSALLVDEDDPVTTSAGVARMLNVVGTAGTATQALVSINYGTP